MGPGELLQNRKPAALPEKLQAALTPGEASSRWKCEADPSKPRMESVLESQDLSLEPPQSLEPPRSLEPHLRERGQELSPLPSIPSRCPAGPGHREAPCR